jgi:AraC family transcriptional regulator
MLASAQGDRKPVTPDERLDAAAVRPTTSSQLGWSGVRAEYLTRPPDAEVDVPPTTHHWLILNHGLASEFSLQFAGREQTDPTPPGSVTLIPAGYPSQWRWRGAGDSTHVLLNSRWLERVAAEALDLNLDRVELPPIPNLSHPQIWAAVMGLGDELQSGGLGGRLLADALGNVLAVHLLRHFSPAPAGAALDGVLPRHKLRAVIDYIHEHLDAELSLDHLAAIAHLSPYHFARVFKNSTGLPPHQYVIARRVERAKELLRGRNRPSLAEVAAEVGFSDQSHFTRHFRRLVGITPRRFQ